MRALLKFSAVWFVAYAVGPVLLNYDCVMRRAGDNWGVPYALQRTVTAALDSTKDGAFLDSCMGHERELSASVTIGGVSAAAAVGAWFAAKGSGLTVDCTWAAKPPYSCNAACAM